MDSNNIDIEQIMTEIREEIKAKGFVDDVTTFDEIVVEAEDGSGFGDDLEQDIAMLITTGDIPWARPVLGGIKGFIMKVIRKLVRFFVVPIVLDQNEFNKRTASVISRIHEQLKAMETLQEELDSVRAELEYWKQKVEK